MTGEWATMSTEAARFRNTATADQFMPSWSSETWASIASDFERSEKTMEALAVAGGIAAVAGNPNGAPVAALGELASFAAKQGKEFALSQADEARAREAQEAERIAQVAADRANFQREVERRESEARDRGRSGDDLRDYRDPPTREQMDRISRTA